MIARLVFHLLSGLAFAWVITFRLQLTTGIPRVDDFGGPWKFLTFWNVWFQLVYFATAAFADFNDDAGGKRSKARSTRDFIFASVAFPMGIFVSATFWTLFFTNRNLIYPKEMERHIPNVVNHVLHTAPGLFQALELLSVRHLYPRKTVGVVSLGAIVLAYLLWICTIAHFGGFWVYPVLEVLTTVQRTVFIIVCAAASGCFYLVGLLLNNIVWSGRVREVPIVLETDVSRKLKPMRTRKTD